MTSAITANAIAIAIAANAAEANASEAVTAAHKAAWKAALTLHPGNWSRAEVLVAKDAALAAAREALDAARVAQAQAQAALAQAQVPSGLWGLCPKVSDYAQGYIPGPPTVLVRASTREEATSLLANAGFDLGDAEVTQMPGILG